MQTFEFLDAIRRDSYKFRTKHDKSDGFFRHRITISTTDIVHYVYIKWLL